MIGNENDQYFVLPGAWTENGTAKAHAEQTLVMMKNMIKGTD
jgi:hypothetical protein